VFKKGGKLAGRRNRKNVNQDINDGPTIAFRLQGCQIILGTTNKNGENMPDYQQNISNGIKYTKRL
jgi:hypothetical protein